MTTTAGQKRLLLAGKLETQWLIMFGCGSEPCCDLTFAETETRLGQQTCG